MRALVTKSTGSWYTILTENNKTYEARTKGRLRLEDDKNTNPVVVGDWVQVDLENEQEASILSVEPRKNYIIRKSTKLSKQHQIIASNIDQLILVVTLFQPETSLSFIDRYLVTAEAYKIKPILIFNKLDLYTTSELKHHLAFVESIYKNIGYQTLDTSIVNNIGLDTLKTILNQKISLLSGHSGVGKSSILKGIEPDLNVEIGEISSAHFKGKHTTTFAEMFVLSGGGYIIDSPGIKSFGLMDIESEFLAHYFPEIFNLSSACKFYNCKHLHEPDCAVIKAHKDGKIASSRYQNYVTMYHEENNKYR